jgi:hypothetical protein
MFNLRCIAAALFAAVALCAVPASAAVILITQTKASAGGVTPGDTPGFPVTLSLPGMYRLDTNLAVSANKDGIQVTGDDVTIDLNGFRIHGANAAASGITSIRDGTTVQNGTIESFKFEGVRVTGQYLIIKAMRIVRNARNGVVGRANVRVQNSTFSKNGNDGLVCLESCHVEGNIFSQNSNHGINIWSGTILGNTISANTIGIIGTGTTFGFNIIGYGNNMFAGNGNPLSGAFFFSLHPNACSPPGLSGCP